MRKGNWVVVISILVDFCLAGAVSAELAITEIMSQSVHTFPTDCDWWELTNSGQAPVNLTGYSWDDDHQRPGENVFGSITIAAGESIIIRDVVASAADPWKDDWGLGEEVKVYDPSYFSGGFSSLGSSDGVFLYDASGVLLTSVTYPSRTAGFSNEWAINGTYLGLSALGENGAYLSANSTGDVASPGQAVQSEPCGSSGRMMYWTDKDSAKIQRLNLESGCVEDILTSADGLVNPRGLAIDPADEKMYWADSVTGVIHRSKLDGSGDMQLVTGLSFPADIALDTDNRKLYFAETGLSRIRCVNLDGSGATDIVAGLGQPYYIELDLTNNRIYWSDVENTMIHRANLDGTAAEDFITGLNHVRDIVLDLPAGKIYWGDRGSSKIQRTNLDGTGTVEDLFGPADGLGRPHGLLLDAAEDRIYWTDTVTSAVHAGNKDGSGSVEDLATGLDGPWAMAIVMVREIKYVDGDATGANDGTSWVDAFNYLQDALSAARLGDEIRVAEGIYRPDEDTDNPTGTSQREATFRTKNGVTIKGGYAGYGEADPDKRDIETCETILSGDLNENDADVSDACDLSTEPTRSENSYHVITNSSIDETAVLDGFTITGGNADGPDLESCGGGGMFNNGHDNPCNPTVVGCTFVGNSGAEFGGGMFNYGHGDGQCNPILTDCTFIGNASGQEGGAITNWESHVVVTNCDFAGNYARSCGGGMSSAGSNPKLSNCTFRDNSADGEGGGMWTWEGSEPLVIDCIFTGNSANSGGGMLNVGGSSNPTLINCSFIGNTADYDGGGMHNRYSNTPTLTNCLFSGNAAGNQGGGMRNERSSSLVLTNCTFSDNSAQNNGGGIHNHHDSSPTLTNCILWGNYDDGGVDESAQIFGGTPAVTYSCIQGLNAFAGNENIGANPLFIDADGTDNIVGTVDDDLRLMEGSPCIDNGNNGAVSVGTETDLGGRRRVIDGDCDDTDIVDMGPYEFSHAYMGDFDYDCDVDFGDFAVLGPAWLTEPGDMQWNLGCNIGIPNDSSINMLDLHIFAENWLASIE